MSLEMQSRKHTPGGSLLPKEREEVGTGPCAEPLVRSLLPNLPHQVCHSTSPGKQYVKEWRKGRSIAPPELLPWGRMHTRRPVLRCGLLCLLFPGKHGLRRWTSASPPASWVQRNRKWASRFAEADLTGRPWRWFPNPCQIVSVR